MREDLEYFLDCIDGIKRLVQLGARSEHHMEQQIFRQVNDDIVTLRDSVRRSLANVNQSKDESK